MHSYQKVSELEFSEKSKASDKGSAHVKLITGQFKTSRAEVKAWSQRTKFPFPQITCVVRKEQAMSKQMSLPKEKENQVAGRQLQAGEKPLDLHFVSCNKATATNFTPANLTMQGEQMKKDFLPALPSLSSCALQVLLSPLKCS